MNLETRMREKIRVQGKSPKTFEVYWSHCSEYFRFCRLNGIGRETKAEQAVEHWLTELACNRNAAKNTQNVALQSVCYLYREVLNRPLVGVSAIRAKRPTMVREAISIEDVSRLFSELQGTNLLAAQMMYATGLRVGLVASLRIKDMLFDRNQIIVHSAKGDKGRFVSFPETIHDSVRRQIESVRVLHRMDVDGGNPNGVSLPGAFRKKSPNAARELRWQYLFPADGLSIGPEKVVCRHHRLPDGFTRAIKEASNRAQIVSRVTSHILRHSYATHFLEIGGDVTILKELLGHNDIRTTMCYLQGRKDGATSAKSPIEALEVQTVPELQESLANPRKSVSIPRSWRVVG